MSADALDLSALKALAANATAAPWEMGRESDRSRVVWQEGGVMRLAEVFTAPNGDANPALIVTLRNAWPSLCAEIEQLRAQLREADVEWARMSRSRNEWAAVTRQLAVVLCESLNSEATMDSKEAALAAFRALDTATEETPNG